MSSYVSEVNQDELDWKTSTQFKKNEPTGPVQKKAFDSRLVKLEKIENYIEDESSDEQEEQTFMF